MPILFKINATDWNGKSLDGFPFQFVGVTSVGSLNANPEVTATEANEHTTTLGKALKKALEKGQLSICDGGGSDYAHFQVSDNNFNMGLPITYGPDDYVLSVSESLLLWLPGAVVKAINNGLVI